MYSKITDNTIEIIMISEKSKVQLHLLKVADEIMKHFSILCAIYVYPTQSSICVNSFECNPFNFFGFFGKVQSSEKG